MAEAPPAALPDLTEMGGWVGSALDDVAGAEVGLVVGVYVDADAGRPVWLIVAVAHKGRRLPFGRARTKAVIVPVRECAAMPGRVWTAQSRTAIAAAPAVDPLRPLLREHEIAICSYYGIGEKVGRHGEIAARAADAVTAQPA